MATQNQPPDPRRRPSASEAEDAESLLRRWAEVLRNDDVEGDWEDAGWDEDPFEIGKRYGIPARVVQFFLRWLPQWANAIEQEKAAKHAGGDEDDGAQQGMQNLWDGLTEVVDAAGTWEDYAELGSERAEQRRYDLTKLLLLAPIVITVALLAMVAFSRTTANDAVLLAAAVLGPLYMPLGAAVAYHFEAKRSEPPA